MTRDPRKQFVVAALLLGTVLLGWWLLQPAPLPPPVSEAPPDTRAPPTRIDALSRALQAAMNRTTRVRFIVMDALEQPLGGVELRLWNEQRGTTDNNGVLVLEDVPQSNGSGQPEVLGPWLVREGTSVGWIEGVEQTRLVYLEPACPGVVRLLDEYGTPVEGAEMHAHSTSGPWLRPGLPRERPRTDQRGEIHFPLRPCGRVTFDVEHDTSGEIPWLAATIEGEETVTLTLPAFREGFVVIVDENDWPLDAEIEEYKTFDVERLEAGVFRVRSRRTWATIVVKAPGYLTHQDRVPLDGGEHLLTLQGGREVEVMVLCDENCPDQLSCSENVCEQVEEDRFLCTCTQGDSFLSESTNGYLGSIPADATHHTLELRHDVTVRGHWTGSLPCHARGEHTPYLGVACSPDGHFEIDGLHVGANTITVRHGLEQQGSVHLDLEAGTTVDLGDIGPTNWTIDGSIDADFPLADAQLFCSPTAQVQFESDGFFLLFSVPPETASLELKLWSPMYGLYRESFPAPADSSLGTWVVRLADIDDTTPLESEYEPGWGDTGDTGGWREVGGDTGLSRWRDSGAGDSGDGGWDL